MTDVNSAIDANEDDNEELFEEWSYEQLRKRSQELQLIDISGKYAIDTTCDGFENIDRHFLTVDDGLTFEFDDVSASTTSDSQVCFYLILYSNLIEMQSRFSAQILKIKNIKKM